MKISLVHSCLLQEMIAMGKMEPRKKACRCRQFVPYKEADEMVKRGEAMWHVVGRERGMQKEECPLCDEKTQASCLKCGGTGQQDVMREWDTYSTDIVMINHRTKTNTVSTPRVPTIESKHIIRAYADENLQAQERIDEYGLLTLDARVHPGPAKCTHRKTNDRGEPIFCTRCQLPEGTKANAIGVEPEDNPEKGEGRNYDYGRAI